MGDQEALHPPKEVSLNSPRIAYLLNLSSFPWHAIRITAPDRTKRTLPWSVSQKILLSIRERSFDVFLLQRQEQYRGIRGSPRSVSLILKEATSLYSAPSQVHHVPMYWMNPHCIVIDFTEMKEISNHPQFSSFCIYIHQGTNLLIPLLTLYSSLTNLSDATESPILWLRDDQEDVCQSAASQSVGAWRGHK